MASESTKILEFSQCQKSDKTPFIVHADLECLIEKIDGSKYDSQNSFLTIIWKCKNLSYLSRKIWK